MYVLYVLPSIHSVVSNSVARESAQNGRKSDGEILTALDVFISTLFLRCSSTLSRFPARAARKNEVFPSDYIN